MLPMACADAKEVSRQSLLFSFSLLIAALTLSSASKDRAVVDSVVFHYHRGHQLSVGGDGGLRCPGIARFV
eukprot:scaffold750_cov165-Ochromonas_danica.AAC.7